MTFEEGKKAIAELKSEGMTEEQILATFYAAFQDDKLSVDELGELASLVGYELTDEFKNMGTEEQKEVGLGENPFLDEEENGSEETEDNEGAEEFEGTEESEESEDTEDNGEEESEESEEDERKKAMKLFGLGKEDK